MTKTQVDHPGFLVWNPSGYQPRKRHTTLESAQREAKRLASENTGKEFYVLVPVGVATVERQPPSYTAIDPFPMDRLKDTLAPEGSRSSRRHSVEIDRDLDDEIPF